MGIIICNRHTKEDLELWKKYEEADLIFYKMNKEKLEWKENKAIEEIMNFSKNKCYASVSWGKDSTVLAYLIWKSKLNIPIINLKIIPSQNPYCLKVKDIFLKKYKLNYIEMIVNYNNLYAKNLSEAELDKETDKIFFNSFKKIGKIFGNMYISGIRAEESTNRMLRRKKYGVTSKNTCAPLSFWKEQDIFSFMNYYDLPIHPNYAMLGGGFWNRKYIRVAEIGDTRGRGHGRLEWEKEYYGDIVNKLK